MHGWPEVTPAEAEGFRPPASCLHDRCYTDWSQFPHTALVEGLELSPLRSTSGRSSSSYTSIDIEMRFPGGASEPPASAVAELNSCCLVENQARDHYTHRTRAASPGLEPEPADSESTVLPVTPRANAYVREGFEPPMPEGNYFADSRDSPSVASHAWHRELPEQDSNLQSRINNPSVYRLTDRGRNLRAPDFVTLPGLERLTDNGYSGLLRCPVALESHRRVLLSVSAVVDFCCAGRIRTCGFRVMSPADYRTVLPRNVLQLVPLERFELLPTCL